ncbi:MAG TPA: hypothetical protein V6C85_33955 [Allocoleopsis sp.]
MSAILMGLLVYFDPLLPYWPEDAPPSECLSNPKSDRTKQLRKKML